jgi:hypothetical protein
LQADTNKSKDGYILSNCGVDGSGNEYTDKGEAIPLVLVRAVISAVIVFVVVA